jgi:hypothetical protein
MNNTFTLIQNEILEEAKSSPSLISEISGLEDYIAETYAARSLMELIQNADDARASRVMISTLGYRVIVANDGDLFKPSDLQSLCRSAKSTKTRGIQIGHRGIGFKSVVGFSDRVHLISGACRVTFCRRLSINATGSSRAPLIRIPHDLDPAVERELSETIHQLQSDGFRTLFIFDGVDSNAFGVEVDNFDPSSMLFLRSVRGIIFSGQHDKQFNLSIEKGDDFSKKTLEGLNEKSVFHYTDFAEGEIAYQLQGSHPHLNVAHAFLPTHELSGLNCKINGNISTDPSRTRIMLDTQTNNFVKSLSVFVVDCYQKFFLGYCKDLDLLQALSPHSDTRTSNLVGRSFRSELFGVIRSTSGDLFRDFRRPPRWLSDSDFQSIDTSLSKIQFLPSHLLNTHSIDNLLVLLSVKDCSWKELATSIKSHSMTISGAAKFVSEYIRLMSTGQVGLHDFPRHIPLFSTDGSLKSLDELILGKKKLDADFLTIVADAVKSDSAIDRTMRALSGDLIKIYANKEEPQSILLSHSHKSRPETPGQNRVFVGENLFVPKWRSAEEAVKIAFEQQGWIVDDVSRQYLGYDLDCRKNQGDHLYVEVKKLNSSADGFFLTSNEEVVARQHSTAYVVALVVPKFNNAVEIALIFDPIRNVKLTRQCRQWVWDCSSYPYEPIMFRMQ